MGRVIQNFGLPSQKIFDYDLKDGECFKIHSDGSTAIERYSCCGSSAKEGDSPSLQFDNFMQSKFMESRFFLDAITLQLGNRKVTQIVPYCAMFNQDLEGNPAGIGKIQDTALTLQTVNELFVGFLSGFTASEELPDKLVKFEGMFLMNYPVGLFTQGLRITRGAMIFAAFAWVNVVTQDVDGGSFVGYKLSVQ